MDHFTTIFAPKLTTSFFNLLPQNVVFLILFRPRLWLAFQFFHNLSRESGRGLGITGKEKSMNVRGETKLSVSLQNRARSRTTRARARALCSPAKNARGENDHISRGHSSFRAFIRDATILLAPAHHTSCVSCFVFALASRGSFRTSRFSVSLPFKCLPRRLSRSVLRPSKLHLYKLSFDSGLHPCF